MLCFLYRWFVSREIDLGKPIPAFLSRHSLRCSSCLEYSDFCVALKPKAAHDFINLLKEASISLPQRITFRADLIPVKTGKKLFSIPYLSAAAAALVILVFLVWLTLFPAKQKNFPEINLFSFSLEKAVLNFEDPYEKEYLELKSTIKSTAFNLASCLDIKIGSTIE